MHTICVCVYIYTYMRHIPIYVYIYICMYIQCIYVGKWAIFCMPVDWLISQMHTTPMEGPRQTQRCWIWPMFPTWGTGTRLPKSHCLLGCTCAESQKRKLRRPLVPGIQIQVARTPNWCPLNPKGNFSLNFLGFFDICFHDNSNLKSLFIMIGNNYAHKSDPKIFPISVQTCATLENWVKMNYMEQEAKSKRKI